MKKELRMKIIVSLITGILLWEGLLPQTVLTARAATVQSPETASGMTVEASNGETGGSEVFNNDDLENATREENLQAILSANPEDAGAPNRTKPVYDETTYTQDVFFTKTVLKGIFSSSELFFYIPPYWETEYVYVELEYTVSELIQSIASSMTFSVNNVPISSCRVSYEDGDTQLAYVEIPMELVREGYNSFAISAYARLYDEDGCFDDYTNANWLSVSDNSYIRSGYEMKASNHLISYYPYPFMSTADDTGEGLTIAVSDKATNLEIAAAMNIMSDLSSETSEENQIQFSLLSDISAAKTDRTVLISTYGNLPASYQKLVENKSGLEEEAVVLFTDDEQGNPLLLITSQNEQCLVEAAYMLMDEDRVSQEKNSSARVKLGSADVAVNSTALSRMVAGNYTVGDIIGSGLSFVGPFHQEQLIYLPFSEDYFLSDAGKVTLKFRYSENLDFNRSLISVYWGNVPVASKKLEKEKASGDELTFSMPADIVGTTTGAIRIAFDLEIPDMMCSPRQDQMPWAYISDESILYLPASTGIVLTFDLKPSPFRTDGKFNDMLLVVSEQPTTQELNLYAQIIGMYGEGVDPYGTFFVKRASEFSEKDSDYNIITIGTYQNNPLLQKLNENLHFSYDSTGTKFLSNEQLILSDNYSENIAIMQLLESPFAENRGILAVTGATEETLSYVEAFMRDSELRYSLTKDCVIMDSDLDTKAYQFITAMDETEELTLAGSFAQNKQSLLFTIVATSVMLMLLIAVIIILIRMKMYHRKKDDE